MKVSVTFVFLLLFVLVGMFFLYVHPPAEEGFSITSAPAQSRLLPLEEGDDLTLIEVLQPEKKEKIILTQEDEGWVLTYPVRYDAEPLLANGLASALLWSMKARRMIREKEWSEYGLDQPVMKIGIETRKNAKRRYLMLGHESPVGNHVYARWEGDWEYFLLNRDILKAFDKSLYTLRAKQIFRRPPESINKIVIQSAQEEFEFIRRDGRWIWVQPVAILGEPVEPERMEELILQLYGLFIKDFLDGVKIDRQNHGFQTSEVLIQLIGEGRKPESLHLGAEIEDKDSYYGYREKENVLFYVARNNVRAFFEILESLRLETQMASE